MNALPMLVRGSHDPKFGTALDHAWLLATIDLALTLVAVSSWLLTHGLGGRFRPASQSAELWPGGLEALTLGLALGSSVFDNASRLLPMSTPAGYLLTAGLLGGAWGVVSLAIRHRPPHR